MAVFSAGVVGTRDRVDAIKGLLEEVMDQSEMDDEVWGILDGARQGLQDAMDEVGP